MAHLLDFLMKPSVEELGTIDDIDDVQFNEMNSDFLSSEFFDNVMSLERENLTTTLESDVNGLLADADSSITDASYFDYLSTESQSIGDSQSHTDALDVDTQLSLSPEALSIDGMAYGNDLLLKTDTQCFTDVKEEQEDIEEFSPIIENIAEATITLPAENLTANSNNVYTIIKQEMINPGISPTKVIVRQSNPKKIIVSNNQANRNRKQLLRVQSLNGNGKSVLLPLNVKNLKKIRIVNTADMKLESLKTAAISHSVLKKSSPEIYSLSSSESMDDEMELDMECPPTTGGLNNRYPPLNLTSEEKRLLMKEGITLPSHYPLTKNEEKDLKRIRRKIRNKISAQDSRKRKKEYVDKLEEKAKRTTEENEFLRKKIKLLHKQNNRLMEQMKKLQALLFNTSSSRATPTTCLMIVLFSTLLVCLPNLKISDKTEVDVGEQQQLVAARRALLFKQGVPEDELNMEDFIMFNKDDDSEMESYEDASTSESEPDNNTGNGFAKFLEELSKKYEHNPPDGNCLQNKGQGYLFDFCNQYQDDIKGVIDNMKEFFEKNATVEKAEPLLDKKFIEPDISDDEEAILVKSGQKRKLSSLTDDRLVKRGKLYSDPIMEDVVSTTVESKMLSSKQK